MADKFPTKINFQDGLLKEFFTLASLSPLSIHQRTFHQINAINTHVTQSLLIQSTCHGALKGKNDIVQLVLKQYLKLNPRSELTALSTTVLTIIVSAHHFS